MKYFSADDIAVSLTYPTLIEALRKGFQKEIQVPPRAHIDYQNPPRNDENTLLLMPAIEVGNMGGVKIVNVAPSNNDYNLPSIYGVYYLMNAVTGEPMAVFDAASLTNWRTAAASALAADYLAPKEAKTLLMIGTGSLAPYLIDAHQSIRPIKELMVYGRNPEKAKRLAESRKEQFNSVTVVTDLEEALTKADIISAATLSETPLIYGRCLRAGQHVDLVGAFKPTRREADDDAVQKAMIYVDYVETAPKEGGDLVIPLEKGIITYDDIKGDLFSLCRNKVKGRTSDEQITLFKSVGHALEDLVAAELIFGKNN